MPEIISTLYANDQVFGYAVDNGGVTHSMLTPNLTPNELRKMHGLPPVEDPKPIGMKLTGNSIIDKIHLEMGD